MIAPFYSLFFVFRKGENKYMSMFGINTSIPACNNMGEYVIAETRQLYKNINEDGFPFQFTCNKDERVFYNAYFLKQVVTYSNKHANPINGIQVYYNIDIMDVSKLSRDYENITSEDIQDIIDQLMPLCIDEIKTKKLNRSNIRFNVDLY